VQAPGIEEGETAMKEDESKSAPIFAEGVQRALRVLRDCASPDGFLASPTRRLNYREVWSRDGTILSLAALQTGDGDLIDAARRTCHLLARHQGPHGEIPSYVDPVSGRAEFGGAAGRVDSDLWFVIGCGEIWRETGDDEFLETLRPCLERVRFLLGAWEFNDRGLLYVPFTGDWADEYLHHGYVLYDQLLYLQAMRVLARVHDDFDGRPDPTLGEKIARLVRILRANFWFGDGEPAADDIYHDVLFEKGKRASGRRGGRYWMPSFSPSGYEYRFDAFGNVLASLLDLADDEQRGAVDHHISKNLVRRELPLLPAFHPVIEPDDPDWSELRVMFSKSFKNHPYEYQNGGLWPMITGFYVADLARRGLRQEATGYLEAIHRANSLEMGGAGWGFPEFVNGRTLRPGGTREQGWSAAAALIGHHALRGSPVFRIGRAPEERRDD
jgi:glycogen debranching enzyme